MGSPFHLSLLLPRSSFETHQEFTTHLSDFSHQTSSIKKQVRTTTLKRNPKGLPKATTTPKIVESWVSEKRKGNKTKFPPFWPTRSSHVLFLFSLNFSLSQCPCFYLFYSQEYINIWSNYQLKYTVKLTWHPTGASTNLQETHTDSPTTIFSNRKLNHLTPFSYQRGSRPDVLR